jgi:eukaryotic-like serine/threonine-protein kinase
MSLTVGSRLGAYEILAPIGAGGMGEVWLARDLHLGRNVALKLLPSDLTAAPTRVKRFEQEARAASALNHPNVCTIHALGHTDDGRHFIAMEHVDGQSLRARLAGTRLTIPEALEIVVQIASALATAHAAGIVHRDIKPDNVMIRRDRLVKVLDFGLAKLTPSASAPAADEQTRTVPATEPGAVVGTVAYMSPEQARGGEVDARTDVWALGVVLYEMVAGRPPFTGASRSDVLVSILDREPAPLGALRPDVPGELQRIVGKALQKDPEERYQVVKDLLLDVKALKRDLAGSSGSGPSVATARPVPASKRRAVPIAAGALALAVLAASAWWWARRPEPAASPARPAVNRPLTRLTFGSGLQTDPTFSAESRFIAYASDRSGNFDIWVQPIGGGDAVQVTRAPEHDTQPVWSPDGRTLVFRSERDGGGLFIVPALGGIERKLASFGVHPTWSSDSGEVYFLSGAAPGEGLWPLRLHRVALDGSLPREVLAEFLGQGSWYWIAPHPDGRISAWGTHRRLGDGFYTVDLQGRHVSSRFNEIPFPAAEAFSARRRFRWHPDGSTLFVQTDVSNVYNLWKIRVDPNDLAWVSAERLTTGAGADVLGTASADGSRLAFSTQTESSRLWLFERDPATRRLGDGKPVTEEGTDASYVTFSRDGRSIAYTLMRSGSSRIETWIGPADGGPGEMIAIDTDGPVWSPDGRALAYAYARVSGSQVVDTRVVIRPLGGAERPVSRQLTSGFFFPKYWTNGDHLLGLYYPGTSQLALWPTTRSDASEPARVIASHPDGSLWQPMYSPNERWLSFIVQKADAPDTVEMYVAPAEGGPPDRWTRLASDHTWPDKPRWAPDGRTLYFISRRPAGYFNVWALGFDPERGVPVGEPFAVSSFDSPGLYISPYLERAEMDVSARHIVLTMRTVSGSVWMLEDVDR